MLLFGELLWVKPFSNFGLVDLISRTLLQVNGMFKSHLLNPYCTDDLWTTIHYPDMGHHLFHHDRLTILEFILSSFLTPKIMKTLPSTTTSFFAR